MSIARQLNRPSTRALATAMDSSILARFQEPMGGEGGGCRYGFGIGDSYPRIGSGKSFFFGVVQRNMGGSPKPNDFTGARDQFPGEFPGGFPRYRQIYRGTSRGPPREAASHRRLTSFSGIFLVHFRTFRREIPRGVPGYGEFPGKLRPIWPNLDLPGLLGGGVGAFPNPGTGQ